MAAVQLKHTASSDILFPEDSQEALNDSFYSQRSASNYSTYSQEVKYIFNPKVATRGHSSQSEYSEIDNFSNNSQRNSAKSTHSDSSKHSPHSRASSSPGGANGNLKNGFMSSMKTKTKSTESVAHPQYGLSIKSVGYPQRHNSVENVSKSQHNDVNSGPTPQRNSGSDVLSPTRNHFNNNHLSHSNQNIYKNQNNHSNQHYHSNQNLHSNQNISVSKAPPQRSLSSESPPKQHTPRIVDANHNHKIPPKPKRLHQMNISPDKPKDKQPPSQEIYATPVLSASKVLKKQKRNVPLPPPPPYNAPHNLNPAVVDLENFATRRRTWSPPTFSRMMGSAGSMQLQAMRCYRSNEQLDVDTNDDTYEDLDTISNASAPPKMANSGQLVKTPHERIIKPIAFKPIITPQNRFTPQRSAHKSPPSAASTRASPPSGGQTSPPSGHPAHAQGHHTGGHTPHTQIHPSHTSMSPHHVFPDRPDPALRLANHSHDDGYMSQDGNHNNSGMSHFHANHSASHGSVQALDTMLDRSTVSQSSSLDGHSQQNGYLYKTTGSDTQSYASSNLSRVSSNMGGDVYNVSTPSPSDSGVGEMEAILRGKDAEIKQLRDTMEKNESAILQVYEEKRQNWNVEVRDHLAEMERRLRAQQQKSFKTEQGLLMQLFKLQQDRKALRIEADSLTTDKEKLERRCEELTEDLKRSNNKGEECNWELQQKSGEISLLKSRLKEASEDVTNKATEVINVRGQVKELTAKNEEQSQHIQTISAELDQSREDFRKLQDKLDASQTRLDEAQQMITSRKDSVSSIERFSSAQDEDFKKLQQEFSEARVLFNHEKEQWLDEKNKVVRYQKHLQLNYVQVMRKNKMLEDEVEQLTLELENRDIKLMTDGISITEEESIC